MSNNKQKLEFTWIGKIIPSMILPILSHVSWEERTDLSYGDKDTDNMNIHGDNLLALKLSCPNTRRK